MLYKARCERGLGDTVQLFPLTGGAKELLGLHDVNLNLDPDPH